MSEKNVYPMRVRIEMTGYDTVRYAVLHADTAIDVDVTCSGFDAFLHSIRHSVPSVSVTMGDTALYRSVPFDAVQNTIRQSIMGAKGVSSSVDSLRLTLAERSHRTFHPQIGQLQISFAEGYGLYGEPEVSPATVTLYGPEEVLARIEGIEVKPTTIDEVSRSSKHVLELEPVWLKYHDVHPSTTTVTVSLPVESYVERDFQVPVVIEGADSMVRIKVYPDVVTIHAWVARRDLPHVTASQFSLGIGYDEVLGSNERHKLRVTEYPDHVRLRSLQPDEVQCVILK